MIRSSNVTLLARTSPDIVSNVLKDAENWECAGSETTSSSKTTKEFLFLPLVLDLDNGVRNILRMAFVGNHGSM